MGGRDVSKFGSRSVLAAEVASAAPAGSTTPTRSTPEPGRTNRAAAKAEPGTVLGRGQKTAHPLLEPGQRKDAADVYAQGVFGTSVVPNRIPPLLRAPWLESDSD